MTFGHVVASPRLAARRRLAILLPLVVGLVVAAVFWQAGERRRTPQEPPPDPSIGDGVCTFIPPPEPRPENPPKPTAIPEVWTALERCLRENPFGSNYREPPTVADVRRWVEVERDPVWLEDGIWWLPLSGEGNPQMPSGIYIGVPLDETARCRGSIVN